MDNSAVEMIRAEQLTRAFGSTQAVRNLNFSVPKGSLFGLMGPDGAGKSTTLRLLCGLLKPTSGHGIVAGFDTMRNPGEVKAISRHMSQGFDLYRDLSLVENLVFFADMLGVPKDRQEKKIQELLAFTHLTPFRQRLAGNLSGGMKQKLALAVALIHTPQVLFLDEPTSGVDPVSRRDFWTALYHLRMQGVTLFITTCYLDEAERCDQVGLLHQGSMLALGSPQELKKLFQGSIIEIVCDKTRMASQVLTTHFPELHIKLYGSRVHLTHPTAVTINEHQIKAILHGSGIETQSIRPISPTLEDVFIALLQPGDAK